MNVINISKREFESLIPLTLNKGTIATEGRLYLFHLKTKYFTQTKLLKKFYLTEGETFSNKLYTLNSLIDNKNKIAIPRIIFPDSMVTVNKRLVAHMMDYIEGNNLYATLDNYKIPHEKKIDYFRQVGQILCDMENARKYRLNGNFFLGDMHEQNFVVSRDDKVFAVDIDSCRILNNNPFPSKVMSNNVMVRQYPNKYICNNLGFIPNENTDLLCYNMMILNYIANNNMSNVDEYDYYNYLQYLEKMKVSYKLLDYFYKLYSYADNESPIDVLDKIPEKSGQTSYKVFKYLYKK